MEPSDIARGPGVQRRQLPPGLQEENRAFNPPEIYKAGKTQGAGPHLTDGGGEVA